MKNFIYVIIIIISVVSIFRTCGKKETPAPVVLDFSSEDYGDVDMHGLQLEHGEFLSVVQAGKTVTIQARISENLTNEMTVNANYFNIEDLITKHGFNTCEEIRYFAVMDMGGRDTKVISFEVDKATIDAIYGEKIFGSQIGDHVHDLWIAPGLK